jgi:hypothetical protein
MKLVNVPKKRHGTIEGYYVDNKIVLTVDNHIKCGEVYLGFDIEHIKGKLLAMDIARLIEKARDIGYSQAQEDIRLSLGIK